LSLLVPTGGQNYNQFAFMGVAVTAGAKYRIVFQPLQSGTVTLESLVNGSYQPSAITGTLSQISEPSPRLIGALQVSPDVLDGVNKYGRLVGLLFSKPVSSQSAQTSSLYRIGGGALVTSPSTQVGGPVKVTGATLNFGDRFVFLAMDTPIGPYIKRDVTVT